MGRRGREEKLGRLYLILGGFIVIVLFAALIAPLLIDWNQYRATFETEAEKLLGQPVRVVGDASATLLPTPSLVFTDVRVGESEGLPMMTVEKFSVEVALMPLISGEIDILDMAIERPRMNISIDDEGRVDWLLPTERSRRLDPSRVSISRVTVTDGEIHFEDGQTGSTFALTGINTNLVEARSLAGPWRVEGSLVCRAGLACGDRLPASFKLSTGRVGEDGTIRIATEVTPADARVAGVLTTDGILGSTNGALSYSGDFHFERLGAPAESSDPARPAPQMAAWRIGGAFDLAPGRLRLEEFTFARSESAGALSLAGSVEIGIGRDARFDGAVEARQIDLDRTFGGGPSQPANIDAAVAAGVDFLRNVGLPPLPGRLEIDVPGVVLGGSVLQNLRFAIQADKEQWRVSNLTVQMPGRTRLAADGVLSTGADLGFSGKVRLTSEQPAAFAGWFRGPDQRQAGLLLPPFDLAAEVFLSPTSVDISEIASRIGDSSIEGSIGWADASALGPERVAVQLDADTVDGEQIQALLQVLAGRGFRDLPNLAPNFTLRLAANRLTTPVVEMAEVSVNASFAEGTLTVDRFRIGDLGGARIEVTGGKLESVFTTPRGSLAAIVDAEEVDGLATIVAGLMPDSGLAGWLERAAPVLAPAHVEAAIEAPAANGATFAVKVNGTAAGTRLERGEVGFTGQLNDWRNASLDLKFDLAAEDSSLLARQAGLRAVAMEAAGPASLRFSARGKPAEGINAQLTGSVAGVAISRADGTVRFAEDDTEVAGFFSLQSEDVEPLLAMAGLELPGLGDGTPASVAGSASLRDGSLIVQVEPSPVGGQEVLGQLRLSWAGDALRVDGEATLDNVDLGWISALALGTSPLPHSNEQEPWPRTGFSGPVFDDLRASVAVEARALTVGALAVANPKFALTLSGEGGTLAISEGSIAGGTLDGRVDARVNNGEVTLDGQIALKGARAEDLVWRSDGQPVAEGNLDLTANFTGTGRSPAGLVATVSGGGTLELGAGTFRFLNPEAFGLVLRAADEGQDLSEERLLGLFTGYLDAGTLRFDRASAAFDIVAGMVEPKTVFIDAAGATTVAKARVDLNTLTLDSSWSLSLLPGRETVEGITPEVLINFSGPLDAPVRQLNVAPLVGYLAVRELQRADQLQADILERERMNRLLDLFAQERNTRERLAREQAENERRRVAHEEIAAEAARLAETESTRLQAEEEVNRRAAAQALAARLVAEEEARARQEAEAAERAAAAARREAEAARRAREAAQRPQAPLQLLPDGPLNLRPQFRP